MQLSPLSASRPTTDWERRLLLSLLWPVLWLQARYVRRITPRMPEPPRRRIGTAGRGSLVRLLLAGDSGAAGVGASSQYQALCAPLRWAQLQNRLAELIDDRFEPDLLVSAVPPMHSCMALPQPLRWFMGRWARQMNATLAIQLVDQRQRTLHWHPESTTASGMAVDGLHPNSEGYSEWANGLSQHILETQARFTLRSA